MNNNTYLCEMEKYAKDHDVPIIEHDGLKIVIEQLVKNNVKNMFEVGTAIGYSASQFHLQTGCFVTTIERDDNMYQQAVKNVHNLGLDQVVSLIHDDALLFDDSNLGQFDCIYIDGAKSQYLKFLEKYISHLKPGGVVIFDNLLFHGYVFSDTVQTKSRNLKQLVRKLETFITNMKNSQEYYFELIEEGDGIGVYIVVVNNMNSKLSLHAFSPIHGKSLIANYSEVMDKIIVGANQFGLRQVSNFTIDDIQVVADFAHKFEVKCYVAVNKLLHNHELDILSKYLQQLQAIGVDGVIFSDLAVPYIIEANKLNLELIYSTETTITNSSFTKFAKYNNITGIETAKEITLDEVNEIAREKASQVMVQIHGHMYMYQSIRTMVDNFSQFQNKDMNREELYLFDSERKRAYPLIQNEQGTHMLASNNLAMIHKLDELDLNNIDSLRIDPLLYTPTQYNQIVQLYVKALSELNTDRELYISKRRTYLSELKQIKVGQKYGTGFFYKKTMF